MPLSLKFLGEFAVRNRSGASLSLPTRKTRALLGYLAVNADRPQPRERLMALLWSDRGERQARQSLNQALLAIRRLGDADGVALLDSDGERVTLRSDAVDCDVQRLRSLIDANPADAALLYDGPFLDGLSVPDPAFEEWLLATRTELHALACDALEAAAGSDDGAVALDCARRLVALDPLREDAHRRLMELLHRSGDRTGALRQYQACAEILQRELQVEPDAASKALFNSIRQDSRVSAQIDTTRETSITLAQSPEQSIARAANPFPPRSLVNKRWLIVGGFAALFLVIGAGTIAWFVPQIERIQPASLNETAPPLPNKPSIAVLPFANLSDDANQEYFTDGMTEDLITDLSKLSGLFVIARNTVFTYKGKATKVGKIARELGVRYVLEGSVRRAGNTVRINAQLVDATTGGQLWAERYDGTMDDVFALQDRITSKITKALTLKLTPSEAQTLAVRGTTVIAAHDAFLKGWNRYLLSTPDDLAAAAAHFKESISLDENYGRAHAALALTYWQASQQFWEGYLGINWKLARTLTIKHLETALKEPTAGSQTLVSLVYTAQRRYADAIKAAQRAVELTPNDVDAYRTLAYIMIMSGKLSGAQKLVETAWRLDPRGVWQNFFLRGLIAFAEADYEKTVALIERARKHNENAQFFLPPLIAAYMHLDRTREARALAAEYYDFHSTSMHSTELRDIMYFWPFRDTAVASRLAKGLILAGIEGKGGRFYELSDERRLSGSEIANLFEKFGADWKIHDVRLFGEYPMQLSDSFLGNGTVIRKYEHEWDAAPTNYEWSGTYQIKGDSLCMKFEQFVRAGGVGCHSVFRNVDDTIGAGNVYVMVGVLGFYEFRPLH